MGKKIAVVVDTLNGGGAEKVCITLVKNLCALGHQACLIVVKPLKDYELEAHVPVYYLLDDQSAKLYRSKNIKAAATELKNLANKLNGFDLVLSNLDGAHPVVDAAESEGARLNHIWFVVHNSIEEKLKRAWKLGPVKYFRQKAVYRIFENKNLVCVSQGLKKEIEESRKLRVKQLQCIYNPVDIDGIKEGLLEGFVKPDFQYVVHAGRFARMKRHDVLFKAFKQLKVRPENSTLKLVLLCEDSKKLRIAIAENNLEQDVVVTGFVQNPYPWYKNAKLLVLSSEAEGFGMVLVEALLCGTRVVSCDCRHGPNEILGGELSQFLSPVADPLALAENMQRALESYPQFDTLDIFQEIQPGVVARRYLGLI